MTTFNNNRETITAFQEIFRIINDKFKNSIKYK